MDKFTEAVGAAAPLMLENTGVPIFVAVDEAEVNDELEVGVMVAKLLVC